MDRDVIILSTNLVLSTLIFWIIAKTYVLPNLDRWQPRNVLLPILLLQSSRHLGLMFLASGATYTGIPDEFAYPAALGDFTTSIMALITIPLVLRGASAARPMLWVITIFGTVDFLAAIVLATVYEAAEFMGAAWWIPAVWVPAALVAHYVTFVFLTRPWPTEATSPANG